MTDKLENAPCLYFSFSDEGRLKQYNQTLLNLLQYKDDDLKGKNIDILFTVATKIFYQTHFFPLLTLHGHAEEIFITLKTKNGEHVPVLMNAVRNTVGPVGTCDCICITVHHRKKFEEELLAAKKAAEAAMSKNAELINARKLLEQHTLHLDERMQVVENRNDELRQLNRVLSHDVQEPIRKIRFFTSQLNDIKFNCLPEEARNIFIKLEDSALRMQSIVSDLQQYVWLNETEAVPEKVNLVKIISEAQELVKEELSEETILQVNSLPEIRGFSDQLRLLFYHILRNAILYRKPDAAVILTIQGTLIKENRFRQLHDQYSFVEVLKLVIKDEGMSFDPSLNEEVFDLFKRLDQLRGRSIGLALCKKIVDNHQGSIKASGNPGVGTTFTLMLPLSAFPA